MNVSQNVNNQSYSLFYTKLYNVVKYRNEVLSADKILANCRLVSFDGTLFTCWVWAGWELSKPLAQKFLSTNQRQGGDQKTKIWKAKNKYIFYFLHFLIPPAHQLKFVHFFSTQPLTTYFTLQRYWAWGTINWKYFEMTMLPFIVYKCAIYNLYVIDCNQNANALAIIYISVPLFLNQYNALNRVYMHQRLCF